MRTASESRPLGLSSREAEIMSLIAEGHSNGAIAEQLNVSERTVESHVSAIFRALSLASDTAVNRRVQAAVAFLDANRRRGP